MAAASNGRLQTWFLGIAATVIGSLIINGILFQRDTREQLAKLNEQTKQEREGTQAVIDKLNEIVVRETRVRDQAYQRFDERMNRIVGALDTIYETQVQMRIRDENLEKRIERLEQKR